MKRLNRHINRSALVAQLIASCPSAERACPEMTGALRVAYGPSSQIAMGNSFIDS